MPLLEWLNAGMKLRDAQAKLKAEHGIEISHTAIWSWWNTQKKRDRKLKLDKFCEAEVERAKKAELAFEHATAPSITTICKPLKMAAMNLAVAAMTDPKALERCLWVVKVLIELYKTERATCEAFVRYAKDERAAEIVNDDAIPDRDKIARLHELMFGEPLKRLEVEFQEAHG